jgi:glycosyltransferase involved in cell wall biosynthesis
MFLFAAQDIHEDRKGLKELIGALEELKIPNTLLVCLGNFIAIHNASFEIRCEGFVGNNRLQSLYYSAADFFVLPSFQEAFCQTPIEAMACGTPVVAFPCSGASDLINEDNGVVCEYFTADALANGIKTAMSREYDPKIIREDVINRFSYDKIAQQYIELYKKVLAQ